MPNTENRIVAAALELFMTMGFERTATGDICRLAGINKGSLYHFFPSKTKLLERVIADYARPITTQMGEIATETGDFESGIHRLFLIPADANRVWREKTGSVAGCLVGNMALELGANDLAISETLNIVFDAWIAALTPLMKRHAGISQPQARSNAQKLLAIHQGAILTAKLRNDENILLEIAKGTPGFFT
jgi:TetR/AcrR family transcriptional regulator, transcriptional repressor for nem operon